MSHSTVAKRYALALFELAKDHNQLESIEEELRVVKQVFAETAELKLILSSPKLSINKKKEIVKEAFSGSSLYVLHTLMLLIDRGRISEVQDVAGAFIEMANDARGVAEATVYSVRPLTNAEKEEVSSSFAKQVGKKSLLIENKIDPELLGGLRVRIGNRIFDGSLRGKLNRLERNLIG
jgi:F-type H+-transporting ATPase subunit delta